MKQVVEEGPAREGPQDMEGEIDEHAVVQPVRSLLVHVRHGDTYRLRRAFFASRPILG